MESPKEAKIDPNLGTRICINEDSGEHYSCHGEENLAISIEGMDKDYQKNITSTEKCSGDNLDEGNSIEVLPNPEGKLDSQLPDMEIMLLSNNRFQGQLTCHLPWRVIQSGALLKFVAIAFGLWHPLGWWSIPSIVITLPLCLSVCVGEALIVYRCRLDSPYINDTFCNLVAEDSDVPRKQFDFNQFIRFAIATSQVFCYLMMSYCVRRLTVNKKRQILQPPSALELVKKSSWGAMNLILLGFLFLPCTALLLQKCCPTGECFPCRPAVIIWYLLLSLVLWLTVVSCLVFSTEVQGLVALAKQCNERILTIEADSINCYIAIHQDLCCSISDTISAYRKWLAVNTASHFWLICYFAIVLLTSFNDFVAWTGNYFICVLLAYSLFVAIHPWVITAKLSQEFNSLVRKLNTTTKWSPRHIFNNRSTLNDFVQYALNTQCQFSQISCSTALPYLSIFLALCGLGLRLIT
ncbi:uncharacterized protein LOC116617732 [Nematostella vectensis]|uniref:uncharacterized protein LOC116617732 n=1 Tax=Nematostella vectensis TaxID=45351 RepID=UPI0013906CF7|nr:uncharacterized protein LOC116617732 [Nematostella vectensis]